MEEVRGAYRIHLLEKIKTESEIIYMYKILEKCIHIYVHVMKLIKRYQRHLLFISDILNEFIEVKFSKKILTK